MERREKRASFRTLSGVYLSLLFLLVPLCFHDGYFDITQTKAAVYAALSLLYLAVFLLLLLLRGSAGLRRGVDGWDAALLVFTAVLILSSLCSGHARAALLGRDNRWQGVGMLLLYALTGEAVSRSGWPGWTRIGMAGGFFAVCALAAANRLGADPLGLCGRLSPFDRGRYLSTIGNIDFLGAYVALGLPVCLAALCLEEKPARRWVWGVISVSGVWAALSAGDSALLGVAAGVALLPLLPGGERVPLRRVALLLPFLALAGQLFARLAALCDAGGFSGLKALLLRPATALAAAAMGVVLYGLWRRREGAALRRARRRYGALLAALAAAGVLAVALANTVLPRAALGSAGEYLVLDEHWGTDRGAIWRECGELFASFPLWQKLIGGGSGCLARYDSVRRLFPDAVVDAAHNELLHYLLTGGVLGLAAYLAGLVQVFRAVQAAPTGARTVLLCGVAAYLAQSAVNIAQPFTTPLFFAAVAMLLAPEDEARQESFGAGDNKKTASPDRDAE